MLKLTYIENSFYLEHLERSLEEWVALRVILALRVGEHVCIEPSTASYLLPMDLPELHLLKAEVERRETIALDLCPCDTDYVVKPNTKAR